MAFMNVKTSAFLVREKSLDLKAAAIILTGQVGIGNITDQIDELLMATAPPADQVHRNSGFWGKLDVTCPHSGEVHMIP